MKERYLSCGYKLHMSAVIYNEVQSKHGSALDAAVVPYCSTYKSSSTSYIFPRKLCKLGKELFL